MFNKKNIITGITSIVFGFLLGAGLTFLCYPRTAADNNIPLVETCRDTLSEWQILQMAMVKTESDFNPLAVGKSKDIGILQIVPIYAAEVNRILGQEKYIHEDAFSPERSLEMFSVVQNYSNPGHDIPRAIVLHNPGGESIGYSKRVLQNVDWIRRYEYIRSLVTRED